MHALRDRPALVAANCVVLLIAGVGFCFWTIYYTDWFPVIGGLLGLTGAFAWVGVFANVLTEDRKKALQRWLDQRCLQSWTPMIAVGIAAVAFFLLVAARCGSVVVDSEGDDVARTVIVSDVPQPGSKPASDSADAELPSSPGTQSSALLETGLFGSRAYDVMATGLPSVRLTIRALRRHRLKLPNDLLSAPVMLLRPDAALSGMSITGPHKLQIDVDGRNFGHLDNYRGTTAWIGTTRDVAIPKSTIDGWRADQSDPGMKEAAARDVVLARWRNAAAVPGAWRLKPGVEVRASVVSADDGRTIASACLTVVVPADRHDFPQELVIHANTDQCH